MRKVDAVRLVQESVTASRTLKLQQKLLEKRDNLAEQLRILLLSTARDSHTSQQVSQGGPATDATPQQTVEEWYHPASTGSLN